MTLNYRYLSYYQNEQFYINAGTTEYEELTIEELLRSSSRVIELRVKKGSLVEIETRLISGDIDIDIALVGQTVTEKTKSMVYDVLNEDLPLPYFFDIVVLSSIKNEQLRKQILEQGIAILN